MNAKRRAACLPLLILLACCPSTLAQTIHHYIFFGTDRQRIHDQDFLDNKGAEGAQLKYTWKQLEPGKDNYAFDDIRSDLAFLKSKNKKLFIQIQDSAFDLQWVPVPKYLREDPQYHGGVSHQFNLKDDDPDHAQPYGWVARRWDPAVRDRFQKLLVALGHEFDGQIEGINLPETAVDLPATGKFAPQGYTPDAYCEGILDNMAALKKAFPKSIAMQYANFMPEAPGTDQPLNLRKVYQKAIDLKLSMGGPDLLPYRPFQMSNSYPLLRAFPPTIPTGIAVQDGNYTTNNPKTGHPVTLPEQIDFATNYLHVTYLFWCTEKPYYERDVLPYLKRQ